LFSTHILPGKKMFYHVISSILLFWYPQNMAVCKCNFSDPGCSVSMVSGYRLDDCMMKVWSPAEAKGFFLEPLCPDQLWGLPSIQYSGYWGSFPWG
jgi:hypothetical protein